MPKLSNTRFNADNAFAAMQVKRMLGGRLTEPLLCKNYNFFTQKGHFML